MLLYIYFYLSILEITFFFVTTHHLLIIISSDLTNHLVYVLVHSYLGQKNVQISCLYTLLFRWLFIYCTSVIFYQFYKCDSRILEQRGPTQGYQAFSKKYIRNIIFFLKCFAIN